MALVSGFLVWFELTRIGQLNVFPGSFSLFDLFGVLYVFSTQGVVAAANTNSLGSLVYATGCMDGHDVLAVCGYDYISYLILFSWSAVLVCGAFVALTRRPSWWLPGVFALVAFVGAVWLMSVADASIGVGARVELLAGFLFLLAFGQVKKGKISDQA